MKRVEKHLRMSLLAFLAAYGGMAFAAPVVAVPGKSDTPESAVVS